MKLLARSLLFAALVSAVGCQKAPDAAKTEVVAAPLHVQTVTLAERPMPQYLTLTGSLQGDQESEVAADVMGRVVETLVDRGSAVKKGDILARVDSRGATLSASAATAQAALTARKLDLAKRECDRAEKLFKEGAITQAEYDQKTAQCSIDQFSAQAATAQEALAAKSVADSVIRAPFDGIVGERYVSVGQYVQASTRVVSLFASDPMRLSLTVPEQYVPSLKVGMPVTFRVSAFGERDFEGTVKFVSPNVRVVSRDLVIEAVAKNPDGALRPGMFATARLQVGEEKQVVAPVDALKVEDGVARVFAVEGGEISERVVQVGEKKDGQVALVQGARAGDALVVRPGAEVKDGAKVATGAL